MPSSASWLMASSPVMYFINSQAASFVLAVGRHNIAQTAHVGLVVHSHGGHLDQLDIAVCRQRAVLQHAGLPGADEDDGRLAGDEEVGAPLVSVSTE